MGVFFVFVGLICIGVGWWLHVRTQAGGRKAAAWPTAAGVVVSSEVVPTPMGGGTVQLPVVTYRYDVGGATQESIGLRVGQPQLFNSRSKAQAVVDRYPVGSQVTVHYDPASPTTAALDLEVGDGFGPLMAYSFGATLFVLGLVAAMAKI